MRAHTLALALLVAGCGGDSNDDDTSDPAATCDPYDTQPLAEVPVSEWPEGLQPALEAYNALDGNFFLVDCDDPDVDHLIRISPDSQDDAGVIMGGGPADEAECGCALDPYYDADTAMDPIAVLPPITVSIPDTLEPSGTARTYTFEGVAFSPDDGLVLRSCAHRTIDPADNSEYDDIYFFLRVPSGGEPDLTMLLTQLGSNAPPSECHFGALIEQ